MPTFIGLIKAISGSTAFLLADDGRQMQVPVVRLLSLLEVAEIE